MSATSSIETTCPRFAWLMRWLRATVNRYCRVCAGIPARAAAGLAHVGGKFYYHAWPEVFVGKWVAVDPTFGQFPADAAHLRFVYGGLARQAELLRLMGTLRIDVLESR